MNIGENIKKYRKMNKMTQAELAAAIGAGVHTVKMWEAGKYTPSVKNVSEMCRVFQVPISDFCGIEDPQPEPKPELTIEIPAGSEKVTFIEEIMKMDEKTFSHLRKYYEFLKNEAGDRG